MYLCDLCMKEKFIADDANDSSITIFITIKISDINM